MPRFPLLVALIVLSCPLNAIAREVLPHFEQPWRDRVAAAQAAYEADPGAFSQAGDRDAPPAGVVSANERWEVEGLILAWGCESAANNPDEWDQLWLDIIDAAWDGADLYIYIHNGGQADAGDVERCQQMLQQHTGRNPAQATWFDETSDHRLDSIWIRDYGPFFVVDPGDEHRIVDAHYVRYNRTYDDAQPEHFATWWGAPRHEWDFATEGGNFLPNGHGLCLVSDTIIGLNPQYSVAEIEDLYRDYLGCEQLVILPAVDDVTGHIDMWITWLDARTLAVGEYTQQQDAGSRQLIETAITDQLSGLVDPGSGQAIDIVRLPMPDNNGGSVWRNYTNGIWIDDTFLMPVYDGFEAMQQQARTVFENHGVTVIPVDSDVVITSAGALHCISRTIPDPMAIPGDDDDDTWDDDDAAWDDDDDIRAGGDCSCRMGAAGGISAWMSMILVAIALSRRRDRVPRGR